MDRTKRTGHSMHMMSFACGRILVYSYGIHLQEGSEHYLKAKLDLFLWSTKGTFLQKLATQSYIRKWGKSSHRYCPRRGGGCALEGLKGGDPMFSDRQVWANSTSADPN